jgi:hypothetical protein
MSIYNYPEPRAPRYKKPESVEECLSQARILAKKEHGRTAMGPIRKGEKILIVSLHDQNDYVQGAITQALMEEGAEKVDFLYEHQLSEGAPRVFDVAEGWKEADTIENAPWDMSGSLFYTDLSGNLYKFMKEHPEYTGVFYGLGGRQNLRFQLREYRDKFRGCWLFNNWEEFLSRTWVFPDELEWEIERRIVDALGKASAVRITDPEGTHLEFPLSADEAKRWQTNAWDPGHLLMDPFQATTEECARKPVSPDVPPVFLDINGVLAGTSNHMGYTPRIQLYFEHGRLAKVEGGGRYGEIIQDLMDKYKDVHWPGYPDKGFFWYCDSALCTVVKAFRRTSDMFRSYWRLPNISERNRAGIFHMGFGSRRHGREYLRYAEDRRLPMGHVHVHLYLATFEIKLRGTDYWYKIIDKGWPAAMDDPEVRALAVKYGNPDELLSFDWIPPLPGINCEGDYLRDYAPDPVSYLKDRLAKGKSV